MIIRSARFLMSNTDVAKCPPATMPEYAFIGRSNVGKSSLINMLANNEKLAKTSSSPGKTQTINHFEMNASWYLTDLPGYGYAKTSAKNRAQWHKFITDYLTKRENLMCIMVLLDSRIKPQAIDLDFMRFLGEKGLPFAMVFTKLDKLKKGELARHQQEYKDEMLQEWEELPQIFLTSAEKKLGKVEILKFISETNKLYKATVKDK